MSSTKEYNAAYYAANSEHIKTLMKTNTRRSFARNRKIVDDAKDKPCLDCGIQYPLHVMDFDHVSGEKKFDMAHCSARSMESLLEEIAKCDVVCANCHRERTHRRRSGGS